MASSNGNSLGSFKIQTSGSEEDMHLVMDQRKRKRMLSNRESARRSRMRKQKHLDDMMVQLTELRKENTQILDDINITMQHYLDVVAENSILKARMAELSQRLQSLNEILGFLDNSTGATEVFETRDHAFQTGADGFMMKPLKMVYLSQSIMALQTSFNGDRGVRYLVDGCLKG